MKLSLPLRFFACFLALLMIFPFSTAAYASSYIVGPGDELYVDFPLRGTPSDLQPLGGNGLQLVIVGDWVFFRYKATVAPDGFISLPSMEPLRVDGLTLEQIKEMITSHLRSFSLRDSVSVLLARANSLAFVVSGEVQHPGRFVYERPTTLMEALAIAGGPTSYSKLNKVMLSRGGLPPQIYDLSEKRVEKDGPPTVSIQPTDVIIVPRRWFTPDSFTIYLVLTLISTSVAVYAATRS